MNDKNISPVYILDKIILTALQKQASDIHFELFETVYRIRIRENGLLKQIEAPPLKIAAGIHMRIKILANLDIAERRLPQDGHFKFNDNTTSNIRVSTCPTLYGEKIILRILKNDHDMLSLDQLGLLENQYYLLQAYLKKPEGLILITGPTGSGKTNTLYSILAKLNSNEINIVSVEDPIEIAIFGINQVNIHPKIGLTFERVLRGFLRQDPDIIMVGEIRDTETAQATIKAAQTGHLVLSSMHTDSAQGSFRRLLNLGVHDDQINQSIKLIINQRLIKKLCIHCKLFDKNKKYYIASLGCQHCQNGYAGRTGIFELLPIDIKTAQISDTLQSIAIAKVIDGTTSVDEIKRVVSIDLNI